MDDIRAFAGDPIDFAVIGPRATELQARLNDRADHYETAARGGAQPWVNEP